MNPPELHFICEIRADVGPVIEIGETALGRRRIIPISGGTFEGPELKGRIAEGGADFQIIDRDGVAHIEARYVLETDRGERIYVVNGGIRVVPPEVAARMAAGEAVDPSTYYFRTLPRFETSAPRLRWITTSLFVATGERYSDTVVLRFWRLG